MRALTFAFLLAAPSFCVGWVALRPQNFISPSLCLNPERAHSHRFMSDSQSDDDAVSVEKETNPCWQDIYDDDCRMSTIYSASFVATEWIKSMPCAAGIEDCDMPEDLKVPGAHQDPGIEDIDVMGFLQLKRATPLKKKSDDSGKVTP